MIEFKRMLVVHTANRKGVFATTVFYKGRKTSTTGMQEQTTPHRKK
jgi:hypothetical protein